MSRDPRLLDEICSPLLIHAAQRMQVRLQKNQNLTVLKPLACHPACPLYIVILLAYHLYTRLSACMGHWVSLSYSDNMQHVPQHGVVSWSIDLAEVPEGPPPTSPCAPGAPANWMQIAICNDPDWTDKNTSPLWICKPTRGGRY